VSRLQLDAAGPVAEDLRKEIDAVAAAADAELPAAQRDALRARIPPAGAPVSDLDLWIAQATLALARSDFDAAIAACDAYLAFVPEEAIALKLRGLARAGAKHWADAADDLAAALQREPAWETELSPRLAACRKAAAEQEERARAEEERREKEERGGEMPEGGDDR
jgi:tetratricopeptide (TPR) repeat protein